MIANPQLDKLRRLLGAKDRDDVTLFPFPVRQEIRYSSADLHVGKTLPCLMCHLAATVRLVFPALRPFDLCVRCHQVLIP